MKKVLVSLMILAMSYSNTSAKSVGSIGELGVNLDFIYLGLDYTHHITDDISLRVGGTQAWNIPFVLIDNISRKREPDYYIPISVFYNIKNFEIGVGVTFDDAFSSYPIDIKAGYNFNFSSFQLGLGLSYILPHGKTIGIPSAYLAARYRF